MSIEKINKKWKELEEQSNPIYIVSKAKLLAEEYAQYRLDQFISEHFNEEVPRETSVDPPTTATSTDCKVTFNYNGSELSAEEKLIEKLSKKIAKDLNNQRDEQIEFFKRLLRD